MRVICDDVKDVYKRQAQEILFFTQCDADIAEHGVAKYERCLSDLTAMNSGNKFIYRQNDFTASTKTSDSVSHGSSLY